jgi:PEP-CTERM motif-containing protein
MVRSFRYLALISAVIAAVPAAGKAATLTEDFTIDVAAGSSDDTDFNTSSFPQFNPALGTLDAITETATGTLNWVITTPAPPPAPDILVVVLGLVANSGGFAQFGAGGALNVSLDGTTTNSSELSKVIGTGVFSDVLATSDPTATGEFTPGSTLQGTITYQYTPVPEPATWAMMALGFAALGFAGRIRAGRSQTRRPA